MPFCHTSRQWLIWNGKHWQRDEKGEIYRLAKETVRGMGREAVNIEHDQDRRDSMKHALHAESEPRMRAMLKLAENEAGIPVTANDLDTDAMLFNALNGTIDLRSGAVRDHRRGDLITKIAPVSLDFAADCPRWKQFLLEVMGGETELIEYLQRAVGYTMTGSISAQVIFMLYGNGANGKTTFLETLRFVFGDYAATADFNSLMVTKTTGPRNDLAKLQGARFVTAAETDESSRLAEPIVKQLTGGDKVTARQLYKEFVEYVPQHKFWLAMNHLPTIRGTDHAIWRWIQLIPFDVRIKDEQLDRELPEKLKLEAPGILAWALQGLTQYHRIGLSAPQAVKDATRQYRDEQDVVGQYLVDAGIFEPMATTTGKSMYSGYKRWASRGGDKWPMSEKRFSQSLAKRQELKKIKSSSGIVWSGIRLLPEISGSTEELMVN